MVSDISVHHDREGMVGQSSSHDDSQEAEKQVEVGPTSSS
jgi:hypothetical protein